jgi:hypothetical protein
VRAHVKTWGKERTELIIESLLVLLQPQVQQVVLARQHAGLELHILHPISNAVAVRTPQRVRAWQAVAQTWAPAAPRPAWSSTAERCARTRYCVIPLPKSLYFLIIWRVLFDNKVIVFQ